MKHYRSKLLTITVEVDDYKEVVLSSVRGNTKSPGRNMLSDVEWCKMYLDCCYEIRDMFKEAKAGKHIIEGYLEGDTDYWGEYDEMLEIDTLTHSPGNAKNYWRRRAFQRKMDKNTIL